MKATSIKEQLQQLGNQEKADHSAYFFKTGKGEYGEGDHFIGCTVPETRNVAKINRFTPFTELEKLHKACGWMLREVGKRDETTLTGFLDIHHTEMPRTMLRYAIERLSAEQKKKYMQRPKR